MIGILKSNSPQEALYNIFIFILFTLLMTLFMRFLWNETLVKHISILNPVGSLYQTFLLSLGIAIFRL